MTISQKQGAKLRALRWLSKREGKEINLHKLEQGAELGASHGAVVLDALFTDDLIRFRPHFHLTALGRVTLAVAQREGVFDG